MYGSIRYGSIRKWTAISLTVAIAFGMTALSARAGNVCVICDGPPAVYSCSYAPDANGKTPVRSARSMQFACIQDVARRYQHSSCKVNRNQLGPCNGLVHMIPQDGTIGPPASATTNQAVAPPPTGVPKRSKEPKTVVDLAKRTARSTEKQIKKSARKVSKAAKSTWRCVTTLFQKC